MAGENRTDDAANPTPHPAQPGNVPLKIVRAKEPGKEGEALDLDVGDLDQDRRYGREDIADK